MAYGSVNVPGISQAELDEVRAIAEGGGGGGSNLYVSKTSINLSLSNPIEVISFSQTFDGNVTATTDNAEVITIEQNGNDITIIGNMSGNATVTLSAETATESYERTIAVTSSLPKRILANNTPAEIRAAAQTGNAANIWSVGDKAPIALNGTVGSLTFNNDTYYAFIIGFNHNPTIEGNNSIHFQFGKREDGTDIAFNSFQMNSSQTNNGGWNGSQMRTTVCPAFKNAMPAEWRNIISPCTKYTDNTGGGQNTASYVTATSDDIFLLGEVEIFGIRTYSNTAELQYQKQYEYYRNGNSRVKYGHTGASAVHWWSRSVSATNAANFCSVNAGGSANNINANFSYGFAPGFKVA